MRFLTMLAAVLAATLILSGPAAAQDRGLERRTELAERYIRLSLGDDLRPMIESVIEQQLASDGGLTPEQRGWYRSNMPVFFDTFMDRLIDVMAPRYAASMTDDELNAGIAFYSSPLGRSLARKQIMLQAEMDADLMQAAEAMGVEIETKYCAAFGCEDLGDLEPWPSDAPSSK
ncbi:MAG TPA: DUF2059 domain-containing protein [Brevundimonas sp.]|jgi:hypothetical protein|uniref:DUF2059 domain-containing protein n=1 Tax=Brevundimonas sp. TaxID=1871086 RepID=UPI002DEE164F|nr:DUF2059 domain-containing protein [Brevundimonas sp.]